MTSKLRSAVEYRKKLLIEKILSSSNVQDSRSVLSSYTLSELEEEYRFLQECKSPFQLNGEEIEKANAKWR